MGKRLLTVLLCLIVMLPSISLANETIDNAPPMITNVEVVNSDGTSSSDMGKPIITHENLFVGQGFAPAIQHNASTTTQFFIYASDALSGIKGVYMEVKKPNGEVETLAFNHFFDDRWQLVFYGEKDEGLWTVQKIIAENYAGNKEERIYEDFKFYVLPSKFELFRTSPIGMTDTHNKIKISFSKEMDDSTFTKENIFLLEVSSSNSYYKLNMLNDLVMTVSDDKKNLLLSRNNDFNQNNNYILIINDSVKDTEGNKLSNPMYINFKYIENITELIGYKFYVNDHEIALDASPYDKNNIILVPLRAIAEGLGLVVSWNNENKEITYSDGQNTLIMTMDSVNATYNGKIISMGVSPIVINGRTLAPLLVVVEAFGGSLTVNRDNKIIEISTADFGE